MTLGINMEGLMQDRGNFTILPVENIAKMSLVMVSKMKLEKSFPPLSDFQLERSRSLGISRPTCKIWTSVGMGLYQIFTSVPVFKRT